jgi:aspartate/methionine/tyrosine aminotransferase
MFVWAKINSPDTSSMEFVDNLLYNREIFITPGSIFGTNGEGYVRLSLCLSQDKLNDALNKLL